MLLADKLSSLRKERNITLQMLQLQTGFSVASLSAYEKGKYAPSIENLCILARFYNISLDEMLDVNIL
jgi:transcriptional regulator with XRE-family HTH domain